MLDVIYTHTYNIQKHIHIYRMNVIYTCNHNAHYMKHTHTERRTHRKPLQQTDTNTHTLKMLFNILSVILRA